MMFLNILFAWNDQLPFKDNFQLFLGMYSLALTDVLDWQVSF